MCGDGRSTPLVDALYASVTGKFGGVIRRPAAGNAMTAVKWIFRLAGIYGLVLILPFYGLEQRIGIDTPPPITHPEYFYGFVGVTAATQLLYLLISADPARYRPAMPVAALMKLSFALAVFALAYAGRAAGAPVAFAGVDAVIGLMFAAAFLITPPTRSP